MTIEKTLFEELSSNTHDALFRLVRDRVYPLVIPQRIRKDKNIQPCIVYQRVGTEGNVTFCGYANVWRCEMQFDSYALKYDDAKEIAGQVKTILLDLEGVVRDTDIKKILYVTGFDVFEPDPGLYRVLQSFSVFYVE